jgi:Ras-related protein Rab-5C
LWELLWEFNRKHEPEGNLNVNLMQPRDSFGHISNLNKNIIKMSDIKEKRFKLVLLGDSGVGKSSIAVRFVKGSYEEDTYPTIGAAYMTKKIRTSDIVGTTNDIVGTTNDIVGTTNDIVGTTSDIVGTTSDISQNDKEEMTYIFEIWDTAGQERYEAITPLYYRSAHAVIIVYDVLNKQSFEKAKNWLFKMKKEEKLATIVLAANNSDIVRPVISLARPVISLARPVISN